MVRMALQKIYVLITELFFRRVGFLFVIAVILWFVLVNQNALQVKTLNYLLPSTDDLRDFTEHPWQMDREKLNNILIYYRTLCGFVKNDPEEPAPCGIAGYADYYLGKEGQAIKYYKRAISLNDRFFWFHYNLGVIYFNQKRYPEAAQAFVNALETPPDHAQYFFMLTKTYRDISKLLDLKPEDYDRDLSEGYEMTKRLYMLCQLFYRQPQMREQMQINKINMHLF